MPWRASLVARGFARLFGANEDVLEEVEATAAMAVSAMPAVGRGTRRIVSFCRRKAKGTKDDEAQVTSHPPTTQVTSHPPTKTFSWTPVESLTHSELVLQNVRLAEGLKDGSITKDAAAKSYLKAIGSALTQSHDEAEMPRRAMKRALEVSMCFLVDCTGSMQRQIDSVRDGIEQIVDEAKTIHRSLVLRVAFVGYRDPLDQPETDESTIIDFTQDIQKFKGEMRGVAATGGGDGCEDVASGLRGVLEALSWGEDGDPNQNQWQGRRTRVLLHISDAPSHGAQFHGSSVLDHHPYGDHGMPALLDQLNDRKIDYYFGKLRDDTDIMVQRFNELMQDWSHRHSGVHREIQTIPLKDPANGYRAQPLIRASLHAISSSVTQSVVAARGIKQAGEAQPADKRAVIAEQAIQQQADKEAEAHAAMDELEKQKLRVDNAKLQKEAAEANARAEKAEREEKARAAKAEEERKMRQMAQEKESRKQELRERFQQVGRQSIAINRAQQAEEAKANKAKLQQENERLAEEVAALKAVQQADEILAEEVAALKAAAAEAQAKDAAKKEAAANANATIEWASRASTHMWAEQAEHVAAARTPPGQSKRRRPLF